MGIRDRAFSGFFGGEGKSILPLDFDIFTSYICMFLVCVAIALAK